MKSKCFPRPHVERSHADTGHADAGHADTGHAGTGHAGTGHADTGHADAGHALVHGRPRRWACREEQRELLSPDGTGHLDSHVQLAVTLAPHTTALVKIN